MPLRLARDLPRIAIVVTLVTFGDGCGSRTPFSLRPPPDAAPAADADAGDAAVDPDVARLVVIVSLDGLRADTVTPEGMPFLYGQQQHAASTLQARCDPTSSVTVPNHLCMVTGRPMDGPDGHHFTANRYVDTILHEERGFYVQSIFDVAHDRGVTTAMVSGKTKFGVISHAYDADNGAPDTVGSDDGRGKIDFVHVEQANDDETLSAGLELLTHVTLPALVFFHLSAPDYTGHGNAFDPTPGTPYADAALRTDERLAELVSQVGEVPAFAGQPVTFIVTSDHGGHDRGHYDLENIVDTRIVFFAWGTGVRPGDLYALNADRRRDPGEESQPAGDPPPIRNCEAGNVALSLLGLPPIEGSVFDRSEELRVR